MKSLNLDIKYWVRVNINSVVLLNILCKANLVLILNLHELALALGIIHIYSKLLKFWQVCNPAITNLVCNPVSKKWITMKKESSLCDTISLIVELLRHHLIEIFKLLILQNLCVKLGNTIYREACSYGKMSHLNLTIIYNCHLSYLLLVTRIFSLNLFNKSSVNLFNNLVNSRKKSWEQLDWPFFKSLSHNCMVSVGNCLSCNIPCLIPIKAFLIHEDSHKFCNCNCWMSIIKLEYNLLVQLSHIIMSLLVLGNCTLNRSWYEEILLLKT